MADTVARDTTMLARALPRDDLIARLQAHAREIREHGVIALAIFGSRARDDAQPNSDLDVLVDYDSERPLTLYELVRLQRTLERLTGLDVHVATREGFRADRLQLVLQDAISVI